MLYSPEKRKDDEQSKTGRSLASKIVAGIMRRGKTDAFAAGDTTAQTSSDTNYEQVDLPRVTPQLTPEQ
jgi:hypothetical protein